MNDFIKDIKKPTDEEKIRLYKDILIIMLNSGTILSYEEIQKMLNRNIREILSQNEITAIYNLSAQMQKYSLMGRFSERIFEFLNISIDYEEIDTDNLMRFIDATVQDIEKTRKYLPNTKWQFQINKIFDRMEGKDPYEGELEIIKQRHKNIKLIEE